MSRREEANGVVPMYVAGAVAAAVIPIPIADTVVISSIQLTMLTHIVHGIYQKDIGQDTLKGFGLTFATASAGMWAASLIKAIPFIGTVVGGVIQMGIAGTLTAALGYGMIELLESGKPITKESVKESANQNMDKARETANRVKGEYEQHKDALRRVGFNQDKTETSDYITFSFNLSGLNNPRLYIKNMQSGAEETWVLDHSQTSHTIDMTQWPSVSYQVKLLCDNLPEQPRFFTKV